MSEGFVRASGLVITQVDKTLYRSAQPKDLVDWAFLRDDLGVESVVKLNTEQEGSDDGARALGLVVYDYAIKPIADGNLLQEVAGIFEKPDMARVEEALEVMAAGGCLLHCTHGQDRTSLLASLYRVRYQGWSLQAAWDEMLAMGYHPEFVGLDRAWWQESAAGTSP